MPISLDQVDHVALLARLMLEPEERDAYTRQLNSILDYMEILNTLETVGVEPLAHVLPLSNVMRPDRASCHLDNESALASAPEKEDGMFKVPRIG